MIKMKLRELLTVLRTGALARLCSDVYLPVGVVKRNRKLWRQVDIELNEYNEARKLIAEKYHGTGDAQGNYRFVTPEAETQFHNEILPLLDEEVTFDAEPILESVLDKRIAPMGTAFLSIDDFCALENCGILIDDEAPAEKPVEATASGEQPDLQTEEAENAQTATA